MAKKLGTIKSISGSAEVIAVDKSGNQRVLKVGDSLYEGETVKTTSADSKVVIATNNGKELSMIGEDTLSLDPKATAADSQVAALQKALLNGANLEDLEETAAGGNSGGRGDGMSLGETRFEHGGHYSNISASTSAINPLGAASFAGPVEGKSGGLDSGRDGSDDYTAGTGTTIDPETTRKPSNPEIKFPEDTNKDGKISDDENKADDNDAGKTTVEVTIPKDGSVKPGDKVVVTDDNGKKTEKPINQDDIDKGKIDIPVDLNPGKDNNVTAEIINPNNPNNPGKDSKVIGEASSTVKVTIDEIIDDVTGGVVNGDVKNGLTNDNLPTFKGSAAPGATVEIYESFYTTTEKTLVGKVTADANGKWSFTPTEAMGDGEHYFEAVATDKVGNKSTSDRVSLDVDTFADAPVIDAVNDNVDSQTGNVLDAKTKVALTNDSTPTLEGYAEPDSVITIYEISELNGEKTAIGTVTADNHGGWKFELPELGDGEYKYTTRAQDKAGNISDFSEVVVVNADLIAPSEPTITFVEDVNPKDGKLNKAENSKDGDSTSTKAQISVPGDAEENDVIHYTVNGEEKTHTITYNDRVTGYVEVKVPVVDGKASSVTAKIVDQAGNASKEVSSSIDSDFTAPNVKITGIIDNVEGGVYKGNVAGTNTNDNKPTIKGTADANQEVVLYDNNKEFGRATADKDGNWEFKPSDYKEPLADLVGRVHVIKAVVTDAAGNTSEATSALEVDTTIGAPKVSIKEDADHNGVLSVEEAKNLKDSKIHWEVEIPKDGTVSGGDVLQVLGKDGKWKIEKVLSNDDLGKSFEYEATLSGKHFESPSYRIVDLVGNQSTAIHANVQLDSEFSRQPSNPSITFPEDNDPKDGKISDKENKAGDNDAGKTTAEISIPKDGSVKPGDKLVVTDENGKQTEKTIEQGDIDNGNIKVPVDLNPGKDNTITAEIINPNNPNNPGKDSKVIGEDSENTKAPEAPVITEVIDDVKGGKFNEDVKGGLTNDSTPTIKGTAKAGSKVEIYDDGNKIGETIAKPNGSWEFTTPELTKQGEHKFTATAENTFGKSALSNEVTIDLDTIAPVIKEVAITPIDTAAKADDTAEATLIVGVTDTPHATVIAKDKDGNFLGRADANDKGGFVIDAKPVNPGDKVVFEVTDKAGNTSESEFKAGDLTHPNDHTAPKVDIDTVTPVDETNPSDGNPDKGIVKGKSDEPNAPVVVTDKDGKTIGTGTTDDKGNFDITTDPIKPGDKVTVEVTDKAGNKGKDTETAGDMDIIHKDLPETPVITDVIDDVKGYGEDTKVGNVLDVEGHLTNDKTPTIKGTAKAGSTVVIYDNGVEIGKIERADANWEFTTPVLTKQGEHKFTAIAENKFGKSTPSNEVTIDLDSIAPKLDNVKITPIDTNSRADDTAELTMGTGHTDTPNAEILFRDENNNIIGKGHANNAGNFVIQLDKAVQPGTPVFVQAIDKAGNVGTDRVEAGNIEHPNDHTAPSEPTITFVEDTNPKDGKLNKAENSSDGDNANTTAKISIPADAVVGDVIKYTVNGGTEESHTITNADKTAGHVEIKVPVTDGQTSSVTAKIVDQAGNASKEVSGSIDVDTTASDAPVITQVTDNQYGGIQDGKNVLGIDNGLTNDSTPTFKGTAEPNTTITLRNGNDIIGKNIQVDANGDWSYTSAPLAEGVYNVTAIATDKAGNDSKPSNVATITVDLHSETPVITEIVDNVAGGVVNGDVKGSLTNDNTPTLKGTAEPFATVEIKIDGRGSYKFENGEVISNWTAVADKDGNWEFTTPKLSDGHHNFEAQATDKAGNNSQPSALVSVDVDTTAGAPKVMITADKDDNSILTATEASALTDGKLKWVIKLPEDAKVGDRIEVANSHREWVTILTLSAADIKAGTITRDDFSADLVKGKTGFQTPSYRIVDQAGNISAEDADSVRFDKTAPKAPVIKEVIDDVKGYHDDTRVGDVLKVEGGLTNDNTPTIKGTAEAGIKVDIYDNGNFIGTTKANTNGNWEFTPSVSAALPDGKHSITAVAKNALDVESAPSNAANIDVDTVTPKPTIDKITDNVEGGVYHGDVKGGLTNDNRPVFEGSAEKGAFIELFDNGKVIGTTKAGEDGKWTIQPKEPMADGKHNMVVQATDLAGNRSRSDQTSSDVDTTPGVVKITAVCDDVAGYNGKVGNILGVNNGLTNDSTPTIKGTAKPGTTITIKDGNSVIDGVIKYNGDGSWEFTPKTPFADGEHKLTAIATSRTSGAQSVSNVATIDVDTTIRIELTEVTPIAEGTTPGAHISTPTINFNTISGGNYVSQGDKSDYVKVNNLVSNCAKIDLGNGNDTLAIGGLVKNGVVINAGRGNDKITIGEYLKGSLVNLGEGGANIVRTRIAGISDEINAAFIIKDKNGLKIGDGKTDADGKFDMFIDKAIKPGEKLSVEIVDAAGNKASDSKAASHIEVSGVRYYDNELDVGTNIHAATVLAGNGNDLVVVGEKGKPDGYITANSKIDLGEGDNEIRVRTNIDHSEIKTGSGDDIVTTGLKGNGFGYITNESKIDLGDGNNKLTVGTNIDHSEIKTGSGDDIVNVGVNGIDGYITGHSKVELGAGNDLLNVRTNIDCSTVDTGTGNDVVKVGGYIHSSKVDLGAGDDTLFIGKVDLNNSKVDGGTGYDKLVLENPDKSVNLSDISKFAKNFEELDISGAKNTTLKVGIKDVLDMTDDKNTLKITGDKGDTVDLKGNGWHQGASEDGYTTYTNNTVTIQIKDEIHVI